MLAKRADECSVGDVLRATEGSLAPVSCLDYDVNDCPRAESCVSLYIWEGLYKVINEYLDSVTLKDMLENSSEDDYCI